MNKHLIDMAYHMKLQKEKSWLYLKKQQQEINLYTEKLWIKQNNRHLESWELYKLPTSWGYPNRNTEMLTKPVLSVRGSPALKMSYVTFQSLLDIPAITARPRGAVHPPFLPATSQLTDLQQ